MSEKTALEKACIEVVRLQNKEYYEILSNLLLRNYTFIKENDPRLSANITAVLFEDELVDKAHHICKFIEEEVLNQNFSQLEVEYTKKLLEIVNFQN